MCPVLLDHYIPPREQPDPTKGTCYFYIGLKDSKNSDRNRSIGDLREECIAALINCFRNAKKTARWFNAIEKLSSDVNFASMRLEQLENIFREILQNCGEDVQSDSTEFHRLYGLEVNRILSLMSSGHAVVLLTVTKLVATVEEKTLILLDEPESHLHPPLLSAFIRALADLLHDQNGVAIIATHSPVVLQEIPRSCVWKLFRSESSISCARPSIETFGENVGLLTSEVFGLEVEQSGFLALLSKSVEKGMAYEQIIEEYRGQIGFEGRALLKILIANRSRDADK